MHPSDADCETQSDGAMDPGPGRYDAASDPEGVYSSDEDYGTGEGRSHGAHGQPEVPSGGFTDAAPATAPEAPMDPEAIAEVTRQTALQLQSIMKEFQDLKVRGTSVVGLCVLRREPPCQRCHGCR